MPVRRLPLGLLAPVVLLALVGALAVLQYQWVGQVSEASRAQLRESLDRRAREFADDFDRELGRAYQTFHVDAAFNASAPDRFARQYDEWRSTARFPGLVKAAYLAAGSGEGLTLQRFSPDTRTFGPVAWPASLEPVRDHLARLERSRALDDSSQVLALSVGPVLPDIPAIVIPEATPLPSAAAHMTMSTTANMVVAVKTIDRHIILELDRDYLVDRMLPVLVDQHFPENGADRYRVTVMNAATPLLTRGLDSGQRLDPAGADARASFFGIRIAMIQHLDDVSLAERTPGTRAEDSATPGAARVGGIVLPSPRSSQAERFSVVVEQRSGSAAGSAMWAAAPAAGWTLLLQHPAGSLDAAVDQVRRHNLLLSFGILSVLLASVGLIVVNARRSQVLAAQQMDFVSTVSHELRTPLAVIRSAAQNLAAGVVHEADQARQYGDLIETEGRRLTDMVEQVLEYAGLSGNRRLPDARALDAGAVIHDVVSSCSALPEAAGVQIAAQIAPDLPTVDADEPGLRRALHNLIGNALKYAADGGWIGVTAARGVGTESNQLQITVADRGRGIPAEDVPHVFEPFFRGRYARERQIHGNGLGLSLVKRIAEAHGGRVTLASTPGQGATFTLHLPIAAGGSQTRVAPQAVDGRPA